MESYTDYMKLFEAENFNEFSRDAPSGAENDKAFLDVSISGLLDAEKLLDGVDLLKTEYDENAAAYFQVAPLPVDSGNSSDDGSECRSGNSPQRCIDSGIVSADPQSKKRAAETSAEALEFDAADPTKAKRLQRNRESAALSRWRKKTAMQTLAVKSRDLERINSKLNYLLACSQSEVQALRAELMRYQSAGTVGQRTLAPGESAVGVNPGITPLLCSPAPIYTHLPPVQPYAIPMYPPYTSEVPPVKAALPLPRLPPSVSRPKEC